MHMRYFYPDAHDALSAKTQFLKEYHRYAKHCFQNTWGKGYVIFDTKEDVNLWFKEHTGGFFTERNMSQGQFLQKVMQ